jgi:hypothetical protein
MSTPSYKIGLPKHNRLKAPAPLRGLDGIALPKVPKGPLPPAVRERADSILRTLAHNLAGQVRRTLGMKPELVEPYGGYASPSHQQWGLPEPSRFPPMKPPTEGGYFVHPSLIEAAAELRALREDLASEDWRDKIRDRANKLDQSRTTTVHKPTSIGPTGWAPTQPDIDLHDIATGFHDSVPAMFGLDSLSHLPERKAQTGTIPAEPPPARNSFGMPVRLFEGDLVRSTRTGGYAQVVHCHGDGTFAVETLPDRKAQVWAASICEAVPAHTAIPTGQRHAGVQPDRPWPRTKAQEQAMKAAPRPRFLQRKQPEPFDFESFFGPLCIVAFMVGLIGAIIANKLVMGVGLIATIVFGVLGLRK